MVVMKLNPTLIDKKIENKKKNRIINKDVSDKLVKV
jgi:hypothetical protein